MGEHAWRARGARGDALRAWRQTACGVSHTLYASRTEVYFSGDARQGARGYKPDRQEEQNEARGCGNFVYGPFHLSMLSSVVHIAAGYHCSVFVDSTGKGETNPPRVAPWVDNPSPPQFWPRART